MEWKTLMKNQRSICSCCAGSLSIPGYLLTQMGLSGWDDHMWVLAIVGTYGDTRVMQISLGKWTFNHIHPLKGKEFGVFIPCSDYPGAPKRPFRIRAPFFMEVLLSISDRTVSVLRHAAVLPFGRCHRVFIPIPRVTHMSAMKRWSHVGAAAAAAPNMISAPGREPSL